MVNTPSNIEQPEYRKIQSLVGDRSLCLILPKLFATHIGLQKGNFVKVTKEQNRIVIEKA